ncbi:UNVERIFIED_CONTAM: hypothetical protein FKN15_003953, partial [Acipenser sinensis]
VPLSVSPQLGIAVGFLIPPLLVPNVDDFDELAHHVSIMFYGTAAMATLLFILVIFVFQEQPRLPPSKAKAAIQAISSEQYSYLQSILKLIRNPPFILLIVTYGTPAQHWHSFTTGGAVQLPGDCRACDRLNISNYRDGNKTPVA